MGKYNFDFLLALGFDKEDVEYQITLWNDSTLEYASDELLAGEYSENLKALIDFGMGRKFILYMFFLYTYSFTPIAFYLPLSAGPK